MEKLEQLYEGKAKKVYATDDPDLCIVSYKDDATAFNGLKNGHHPGQGRHQQPHDQQLHAHAGAKRRAHALCTGALATGRPLVKKVLHRPPGGHHPQHLRGQLCQALRRGGGHRLRRAHHRVLLQGRRAGRPADKRLPRPGPEAAPRRRRSRRIKRYAFQRQRAAQGPAALKQRHRARGLQAGVRPPAGRHASSWPTRSRPDTCRFWDVKTHEKLDKDRFRRDLGGVEDAYQEVMRRLIGE